MASPGQRVKKRLETAKQEKRQSRKESRAKIVNSKRNINIDESKTVGPVISEAEKLKLWRMEKKRKMEEEKLRRRPPFLTYINVKHTGTSPFKKTIPLTNKPKSIKNEGVTMQEASRGKAAAVPKSTLEIEKKREALRLPGKSTFNFNLTLTKTVLENNKKREVKRTTRSRQIVNNATASSKPAPINEEIKMQVKSINKPTKKVLTAVNKIVAEVEKNVRVTKSTSKQVNTRSTKKTELDIKATSNKQIINKKEPTKMKTQLKENKENIPVVSTLPNNKTCNDCGKVKQYNTRSRKGTRSAESTASTSTPSEPLNGPAFQRMRLQEETTKLLELKEKWLNKEKEDSTLPDGVHDEILSVTGLTTLLITSKFEQFKSLIEDCAEQLTTSNVSQRIVPDDLDGFWEMMYLQVVQLHNKYANLERLMLNNWKEPSTLHKTKPKKSVVKTPMPNKRRTRSRFQEFLNKKREENQQGKGEKFSPSEMITNLEDIVSKAQHGDDCEPLNLNSLKSCLTTPKAVKNLLTARKSRRSSMNIVMSMSGLGKFDISGTALPSPKLEKKVMFANVD